MPNLVRAEGRLQSAFTLIELLVAVAILGVLIGFVLPAVQRTREASRRIYCLNHLKQIGLALNSYSSLHGFYPAINSVSGTVRVGAHRYSVHYFSPSARMLSELSHVNVYNAVNFTFSPSEGFSNGSNQTVMLTSLEVFLCPSDRASGVAGFGRNNYHYNVGPTPWYLALDSRPESSLGPFTTHRFYQSSDFSDGLSNTVGVSERIQGDWTKEVRGPGDYLLTPIGDHGKRVSTDRIVLECGNLSENSKRESRAGESWFLSGFHFSNYNHCLRPNATQFDCSLDTAREDMHQRTMHEGVFSARSYHGGGVNAVFMDGSAQFIRESIHLSVWRGLATRSNGDITAFASP